MDQKELLQLINALIKTWENEVVEFKCAGDSFPTSEIGKYFSALSNEANLRNMECGWFVFGVENKTRRIVGTEYRSQHERLQSLKMQIAQNTEPSITFRNIHEVTTGPGRVILFEIPSAPLGMPVSWKGHYYARAGESLTALGMDKLDEIRGQISESDWSGVIVESASVDHLDLEAIKKARVSYARKYANRFSSDEINKWDLLTFLDRARLTKDGQITRATLLLIGKSELSHLLTPHPAQITWKLETDEKAYEHFGPPFLLSTTLLYQKIRNIQVRILPEDALLPIEVAKYDRKVILEALHNCIAHQDYCKNGRVVVTEYSDKLVFENEGSFFEGKPDEYILGTKTPRRYRNSFLVQAMTELNMIDTMGYGIHEMHVCQARRFLPLPDYDLSESSVVRITIHGKTVDPSYSRLLIQRNDLSLSDILALDHVQKKIPISEDVTKRLRHAGLIEGRKPHLHISAMVAKETAREAEYIKTRAQDDTFYVKLIIDYLTKFKKASRKEIDNLLWNKLSDAMDSGQKRNKVANLLTNLRRAGRIYNSASKKTPSWELAE